MKRIATRSFIAAALVLALLEGSMRLFMTDIFVGRFEYGYHPDAGFFAQNDGTMELRRTGGRRFWQQRFPIAKPPGALRVITVGDSISRGASLEEAYPFLLGRELSRPARTVESINLSVPGYGARRKQMLLEKALSFSPDLIILHVGTSNEFEDERDWRRYQEFASGHPRNWLMKSYLLRRLYEVRSEQLFQKLLPAQIRAQTQLSDAEDEAHAGQSQARQREWRERFEQVSAESLALAASRKVPVILVPRAVWTRGEDGRITLDEGSAGAWCDRQAGPGVRVLHPAQALGDSPDASQFSGDRVHLKPSAHLLLAKTLAAMIGPTATKQ